MAACYVSRRLDSPPKLPDPMRKVVKAGLDYGHRSGIVFPTRWHGPRGIGGIGLASELPGPEFEKILAEHEHTLHIAALSLHSRLRMLETMERIGRPRPLRPRERDILALVAEGYTNGEIAERLGISPRTVSGDLSDIYTYLGTANRTQAAVLAAQWGL